MMDENIEKKNIEATALSDAMIAAERELKHLISEAISVRNRIAQLKNNSKITATKNGTKEFQDVEKAIETAMEKLKQENAFLLNVKSDYEHLKKESNELLLQAQAQKLEIENNRLANDTDEMTIAELKNEIDSLKSVAAQRPLPTICKFDDDFDPNNMNSKMSMLRELIHQAQEEKEKLEDEIRNIEQSTQILTNRNNAMLRRLDVQIADMERRQETERARVAFLMKEIEHYKKEISRCEQMQGRFNGSQGSSSYR